MKSKRIYPAFTISKKGEMSLKNGHPWVYCDELRNEPEGLKNGELCDVFSEKGSYLGTGFLSLNSKIRIRILSDNANENFSENFFRRRIRYAIDYRKTVMGDDFSACRLIFGEADGMPGLTIDKYGDILVSQVLSYGMDMIKDMIFRLLVEELEKDGVKVSGIMERNDVAIRKLEGLEQYKGWYRAEFLPEPPSNIQQKSLSLLTTKSAKRTSYEGSKTGTLDTSKARKSSKSNRNSIIQNYTGEELFHLKSGYYNHKR
jgi:23S rRNA (cytosine1962-C5)-methyltransferase